MTGENLSSGNIWIRQRMKIVRQDEEVSVDGDLICMNEVVIMMITQQFSIGNILSGKFHFDGYDAQVILEEINHHF